MPDGENNADLTLTAELVTQLVRDQYPHLLGPVTLAAHGWDSDTFRLGDDLAVRLPRRTASAGLVQNEQRWLVELAPRLPVNVPAAVAVGAPGRGYPWSWSILPWYPGVPADGLAPSIRDRLAAELASAATALHHPAPTDAPHNPYRGVPLVMRDPHVRGQLAQIDRAGGVLERVWQAALRAPQPPERTWVHGDLHPGNVLVDPEARLSAIIDFGDLCGGDPAVDLAAAWLFFRPAARATFVERVNDLGTYDREVWIRARGWALAFSLGLLFESDGSDRMTALGWSGIDALEADD